MQISITNKKKKKRHAERVQDLDKQVGFNKSDVDWNELLFIQIIMCHVIHLKCIDTWDMEKAFVLIVKNGYVSGKEIRNIACSFQMSNVSRKFVHVYGQNRTMICLMEKM